MTRPDIVESIHHAYLEAGADIIETNSFSATRIAQADYGLDDICHELNVAAAGLARRAADAWTARTPDRPRFVAGALGPTNRTLSISPDVHNPAFRAVTFDEVESAYYEQARGLIEGGVDLLLVEMFFDTLNAKAALVAIDRAFDNTGRRLPVMVSVTITDRSGRTLSGQTIDAFWVSIAHARPFTVGVNCALGAKEMRPHVAALAQLANCYVTCYPNAGLPNAIGEYDEEPEYTASQLREFATAGLVNVVGGCCGTTPDHVRAIAGAVAGLHHLPSSRPADGQSPRGLKGSVLIDPAIVLYSKWYSQSLVRGGQPLSCSPSPPAGAAASRPGRSASPPPPKGWMPATSTVTASPPGTTYFPEVS